MSDNPRLPKTWSATENVEWVAEIPGMGWSSPIVWEGKVFLTTATAPDMKQPSLGVDFSNEYVAELEKQGVSEEEMEKKIYERDMEMPDEITLSYRLVCVDLESGKTVWDREFHPGHPPVGRHRKNSFTSETPVTDGKAVYVYVAHLGLWAFDFEGKQLWHTPLEPHQVYLDFGGGTSPALWKDRLFVLSDNEDKSFIAAFDTATGKRAVARRPHHVGRGGPSLRLGDAVRLEQRAAHRGGRGRHRLRRQLRPRRQGAVAAADPVAGRRSRARSPGRARSTSARERAGCRSSRWRRLRRARAERSSCPPSPVRARTSCSGTTRPRAARYLPTPVVYDGMIYVLNEKGILAAHDATTGKQIYKSRIHTEARNFTASPWAYGDAVFMINEEGTTFVIDAGNEMKVLGVNRLGDDEFVEATPAISGDRLLIRTQGRLYSIRQAQAGALVIVTARHARSSLDRRRRRRLRRRGRRGRCCGRPGVEARSASDDPARALHLGRLLELSAGGSAARSSWPATSWWRTSKSCRSRSTSTTGTTSAGGIPTRTPTSPGARRATAAILRRADVFTPQLVVDGEAQLVGSDRREALAAIARAAKRPRASVEVARVADPQAPPRKAAWKVAIDAGSLTQRPPSTYLFVALTEDGLASSVARGENAGQTLRHVGVVRALRPLGRIWLDQDGKTTRDVTIDLDPSWQADRLHIVAWLADGPNGRVLGSARVPF